MQFAQTRKFKMNTKFYLICLTVIISLTVEGRLVKKNKTKTTGDNQTEKAVPTIRLTRNIEYDHIKGFSKEHTAQSDEFIQLYNKRAKHFFKSKSTPNRTLASKLIRIVRNPNSNIITNDSKSKIPLKLKTVLVKQPIPKFSDIDYEDDFQTKMSSALLIVGDSGDHEDEDFNLDDYDFDVNHDEFTSGRKPLEPRLHRKNTEAEVTVQPEIKMYSKVIVSNDAQTSKKERSADLSITGEQQSMKSSEKLKEDFYYDDLTSTKVPYKDTKVQQLDSEYSDENDDSNERDHKPHFIRSVRSWDIGAYLNKFGDKTSKFITKFLGVLPMFPQVPDDKNLDKNSYSFNE